MKTDFIGKSVDVGDYIFYSTTGRYAESRVCVVTRFTAKSMFVKVVKHNRPGRVDENEVIVRNTFVKLENYGEET